MSSLTTRQLLGRRGERLAAEYLDKRGWKVIGSGFLARRGEVDLVCRSGASLVLVEVKTRSGEAFGTPAEAVGPRKRKALGAAAAEYRALAGWRGEVRFAVVSLLLDRAGEVRSIELIEDPF